MERRRDADGPRPIEGRALEGDEEVLRLEGVSKWFSRGDHSRFSVLSDVNLRICRGEVLVVFGPSGAGKSTLLRCVNLLTPPDEGRIFFMGKEARAHPPPRYRLRPGFEYRKDLQALRSQIGIVFQHLNLFPHMTACRNIAIALVRVRGFSWKEANLLAIEQLAKVGLADRADHYPSKLSGGERQRVAIARALAMEPQLMLFDEITSALDPELTASVLAEVRKLAFRGMTMIVVTHEIRFAREVADTAAFIESGRLIEHGPAVDVLVAPQHPRTRRFIEAIL